MSRLPELPTEHFLLRTTDEAKAVLFVATSLPSAEQRQEAYRYFFDANLPYPDLMERLNRLFSTKGEAVVAEMAAARYLAQTLPTAQYKFILVDVSSENFAELNRAAQTLYPMEVDFQLQFGEQQTSLFRQLILATVGAPAYVFASNQILYRKDIIYRPLSEFSVGKSDAAESEVNARYKQLLLDFKANPATREQFIRFARKIRAGEYKGQSKAAIEEDVLKHFWRPAHPKIRAWISLAMSDSHPTNHPRKPIVLARATFEQIFKSGKGIIFVSQEKFPAIRAQISATCSSTK